jgi:hypothetical protein
MVAFVTHFRFLDLVDFEVNLEVRLIHLIGNSYLSMGRKKTANSCILKKISPHLHIKCVNHTDRSTQKESLVRLYFTMGLLDFHSTCKM